MLNNPIVALLVTVALWLAVWGFVIWSRRQDYKLGGQACKDGLPMNARWSASMQAGWFDEFQDRMLRAELTDRRAGK